MKISIRATQILVVTTIACQVGFAKAQCVNKITDFALIDATNDQFIRKLPETLNVREYKDIELNFRAKFEACPSNPIQSVLFIFAPIIGGKEDFSKAIATCDRFAPYTLMGDSGDVLNQDLPRRKADYNGVSLNPPPNDSYVLRAHPFSGAFCDKGPGEKLVQNITLSTDRPSKATLTTRPNPETALPDVPRFCAEDSGSESRGYQICLDLKISSQDVDVFLETSRSWSQKITGDLPKVDTSGFDKSLACRSYPKEIDDLYICGQYEDIDGELGVLGRAGPTYLRRDSSLPVAGQMIFDSADMSRMRAEGTLKSVILHEVGHVVGIGTLWESLGVTGRQSVGCPYLGEHANREWRTISDCSSSIPTEQKGGPGTRCGHWDETCMRNELMTGLVSINPPSFSRMTIASLADMGYEVDYSRADVFKKADLNPNCVCNRRVLRGGEATPEPFATLNNSREFIPHRHLSAHGLQVAKTYGRKHLQKMKELKKNMREDEQSIFVGDQFISVLYEEDGHLYRVDVS